MRSYPTLIHAATVLFLVLFFAPFVVAQKDAPAGTLLLAGKVVNESKRGMQATIYVYRNRELLEEFQTSKIGKFSVNVKMQDSITFVVCQDHYVSKTVVVDTRIHRSLQQKDYVFPFFIDLYPVGRTPSHIDLDRPVGKIIYEGGQFIYDLNFTKQANEELKEFVKERKDLRVRPIETNDE